MKKKAICLLLMCLSVVSLGGCKLPFQQSDATPSAETIQPPYYLSETELPNDAFYIVRDVTYETESITGKKETVTETRYYPLLQAENTLTDTPTNPTGYNASRIEWVNYNIDEGKIPTMYADDKMIYKSPTYIPTNYSLEKFFDEGYTIGVMGLRQDTSGNYRYDKDAGAHVMSTSDAAGFDGQDGVESLYLAQVGDQRVTPLNVSPSGTVTGLELGKVYPCDIRTGTKKVDAKLTANIHYFSSAETYFFGSFTFITPEIAQINIPSYAQTGYYNIGQKGFFRLISDETVDDWTTLEAADYNSTIYTYNEQGSVDGTNLGLIFDENGFLVPGVLTDSNGNVVDRDAISYEDSQGAKTEEAQQNATITNPTRKTPKDGYYTGTYRVTSISDPVISGSKEIFELEVVDTTDGETLNMRYAHSASNISVSVGGTYGFMFKEAGNGFDGYEAVNVTNANETPIDVSEDAEEEVIEDTENE